MAQTPRVVPVTVPMDRLAVGAYLSFAVTRLKASGELVEGPPHEQVTPFGELPEGERAGWLAAVQSILQHGGTMIAMMNPAAIAVEVARAVVGEIQNQYKVRNIDPAEVRFPAKPTEDDWQMWGRVTARILEAAQLTIPAAVTKGELRLAILPDAKVDEGEVATGLTEAVVAIPADLYRALLASGFDEGEVITIAIMDPHWDRKIPDGMTQSTEGGPH